MCLLINICRPSLVTQNGLVTVYTYDQRRWWVVCFGLIWKKHTHEIKFWEEPVIRILLPMLHSNEIEQQELFRLHVLMLFYQLQHWNEWQQHKYAHAHSCYDISNTLWNCLVSNSNSSSACISSEFIPSVGLC